MNSSLTSDLSKIRSYADDRTCEQSELQSELNERGDDEIIEDVEEGERPFRVAVLGFPNVGKSFLTLQYVYRSHVYEAEHNDTILDTYHMVHEQKGKDKVVELEINEVGGGEALKLLRERIISEADAFVLVYSIIDRSSFERLHEIIEDIRSQRVKRFFPCVLVENKNDVVKQRCVAKEEGKSLAHQIQATFISSSAKNHTESAPIFECVLQKIFSFDYCQEIQGYIVKGTRAKRRTWRKKWFIIDGTFLIWKKSEHSKKDNGMLDMRDVITCVDINEKAVSHHLSFTQELTPY